MKLKEVGNKYMSYPIAINHLFNRTYDIIVGGLTYNLDELFIRLDVLDVNLLMIMIDDIIDEELIK
jgi:hypothetical protein